jgi:SAM-dependent MidA family methyltransferase
MTNSFISTWFKPGSSMWFVEFMQQALYHPTYGYYTRERPPFGEHGDFVTAPELTSLFGQTLANCCKSVLSQLNEPVIFEFGAGSGKLCVDILTELERLQALPTRYVILEVSHALQQRQKAYIAKHIPHLMSQIEWIYSFPAAPFQGMVLANEVLDAMPVHRFKIEKNSILESRIEHTLSGELVEHWEPCPHERIVQHIQSRQLQVTAPYISECNGMIEDWIAQSAQMLKKGLILLIDYGFPAHEYYHPDRTMGTLMCHYRHTAHPSPFIHVGEQDITAHVDFTHVAEAAVAAGLDVAWFANQASFLLDNGLLDLLATVTEPVARFNANQVVNQLLSPSEMGELFKVLVLTKACFVPDWNRRHDRRVSL